MVSCSRPFPNSIVPDTLGRDERVGREQDRVGGEAELVAEAEIAAEVEARSRACKIVTMLLVEDDRDHARLISETLKPLGADLVHVATCSKALAELDERCFDVVLLDMNLPDGTGLDVQKTLIALGSESHVVYVTSDQTAEKEIRAMKCGAADYVIKKPNYLKQLEGVIARLIGGVERGPKRKSIQRRAIRSSTF